MKKTRVMLSIISVIVIGLLVTSSAYAKKYEIDRFGTKSCTGSVGGNNDTRYGVRNRNHGITLIIKAIRVYDADANLVYDSSSDGFIGGIKTVLPPLNSTAFWLSDLITAGSGSWGSGPGIMEIDWRAGGTSIGLPLSAGGFRRVTDGSGNILSERPQNCREIPL